VNRSLPLGIIFNELVTNASKYVFPEGWQGKVNVVLKQDLNEIDLQMIDNGSGNPAAFDTQKSTGIGMQYIVLLSDPLQERIEWNRDTETTFTLRIPVKES
jgi:two-component sensor histidine kinase